MGKEQPNTNVKVIALATLLETTTDLISSISLTSYKHQSARFVVYTPEEAEAQHQKHVEEFLYLENIAIPDLNIQTEERIYETQGAEAAERYRTQFYNTEIDCTPPQPAYDEQPRANILAPYDHKEHSQDGFYSWISITKQSSSLYAFDFFSRFGFLLDHDL